MRLRYKLLLLFLALLFLAGGWIHWQQVANMAVANRLLVKGHGHHQQSVTVTWFGVSTVLITDGETALLIDPFFTRPEGLLPLLMNRKIQPDPEIVDQWLGPALSAVGVEKLAATLVSHSHYDHVLDVGPVVHQYGGALIGSSSTLNIGRGAAVSESSMIEMNDGDRFQFGDFAITVFRSAHAGATGGRPLGDVAGPLSMPARYSEFRQGGTWTFLIEHPQGRVLHHGSANWSPGMYAGLKVDAAIIGVAAAPDWAQYFAQLPEFTEHAVIFPVHWDNFFYPLEYALKPLPIALNLESFAQFMHKKEEKQRLSILPVAESVRLFYSATATD